jgi:hypothetical protein
MKVLGERPYAVKDSIKDYLEELETRQQTEDAEKEVEAALKATSDA